MLFAHTTQRRSTRRARSPRKSRRWPRRCRRSPTSSAWTTTPLPSAVTQPSAFARATDRARRRRRASNGGASRSTIRCSSCSRRARPGKPKCIVHGAGGTLLEHLKEHRLHGDLRPGDTLYFHTSCCLDDVELAAVGAGLAASRSSSTTGRSTEVDTLWRLVADERVTVFGTSPAYLQDVRGRRVSNRAAQFALDALRAVLSTGADALRLAVRLGARARRAAAAAIDLRRHRHHRLLRARQPEPAGARGRGQCRAWASTCRRWRRRRVDRRRSASWSARNPFPSRPLGFFGDADGSRFHAAYFAQNPGVWTHGDLIEFSAEGTARLHGRTRRRAERARHQREPGRDLPHPERHRRDPSGDGRARRPPTKRAAPVSASCCCSCCVKARA